MRYPLEGFFLYKSSFFCGHEAKGHSSWIIMCPLRADSWFLVR